MTAAIAAPDQTRAKAVVREAIGRDALLVTELAHEIHGHPETAFQEVFASDRLAGVLADRGFAVERGVGDLPTAFKASTGTGDLHVAFCAEYDALDEDIGHGCGHNLIAGAAVAAALALDGLTADLDLTVSVVGTPGEELLGLRNPPDGYLTSGKIVLLEAGVFDAVDAVLMLHPGPSPYSEFAPSKATLRIRARFGRRADRRVAIDATGALELEAEIHRVLRPLRQPPYFVRVAAEGQAVGAVAELSAAAATLGELLAIRTPIRRTFEAAAGTAGVDVAITEYTPNAELRNDPRLAARYRENAERLGAVREAEPAIGTELRYLRREFMRRTLHDPRNLASVVELARHPARGLFLDRPPVDVLYGTDLGQVSQVIPSIHPLVGIGGTAPNNTAGFTPLADTDEAYRAMLDGATALAWTAVDGALDPRLRAYLLERRPARSLRERGTR